MRAKVEMDTNQIKVLIGTNRDRFMKKVVDAMERKWEAWSAQAAKLHIFHANQENRWKEGILQARRGKCHINSGGSSKQLPLLGPTLFMRNTEVARRI